MLSITYSRERGTNWYRVRWNEIERSLLVHRNILVREIGMNPRCEVGCKEVTIDRIIVLGFLPVLESIAFFQVERSGTY